MNRLICLVAGAFAALPSFTFASAIFSIDGTAPPANVILSNASNSNASFLRLAPDPTAREGKGQTFVLPDAGPSATAWAVSELTLQKNGAQTFASGSKISLWAFQYAPANNALATSPWSDGDGISDGDPLDGTGVTTVLLGKTDLPLSGPVADGQYLHVNFVQPLLMDELKAYAFYLEFAGSITSPTTGTNPSTTRLQLSSPSNSASSYAGGQFLLTSLTTNSTFAAQDYSFHLVGTAVPEPASAAAAMLGAGLLLMRRKRRAGLLL